MAFLSDFHFWHIISMLGLIVLNFALWRQIAELTEILLEDDEEPEDGNQ